MRCPWQVVGYRRARDASVFDAGGRSLFDAETERAQCLAQFRTALERGGVLHTVGNGCRPAVLRKTLFFLKRLQDLVIGIKIIPCGLRISFMKQDG